jgi:glycosyltransferase involved in cell wall biosynthesis
MKTNFICHTGEAALATRQELKLAYLPSVCLHPVLTQPATCDRRVPELSAGETVLVAGQYKPSRDLELLSQLGPKLRTLGLRPRIVGRGWPAIEGWEIEDRFLTEHEFETEIRSAAAIVIPYQKYWQSGVAIQALEQEIPVVGAATAFLRTLFDEDYPGLVRAGSSAAAWLAAISAVVDHPPDLWLLRKRYQDEVDKSWSSQLALQRV